MAITAHDYLKPAPTGPYPKKITLANVFLATAAHSPDAIAVSYGDREYTWRQWQDKACAAARGLREIGIKPGDVVAVKLPNCMDFLVLHVAVAMAGAIMLPIHVDGGISDTKSLLRRTTPSLLVLPESWRDVDGRSAGAALKADIPELGHLLVADGPGDGPGSLEHLTRRWTGTEPGPVEVREDAPLLLVASSGTTSARPKICTHSHRGLLSNAMTVVTDGNTVSPADTILSGSQFSFLFGMLSLHIGILTGARQVLSRNWAPGPFLTLAAATRPTLVYVVPTQIRDLLDTLSNKEGHRLPRVREIRTAGAPVSADLVHALTPALADHVIVQWGMSEVGAGISTLPSDPAEAAAGTIGVPSSGARARVVDDQGLPCPTGTVGMLEFHGPSLFRGYFREPGLTDQAFTADGWLRTGDLASVDSAGRLTLHGRLAGLINVGGRKVNADEVERLLADFPPLREAVVVGLPDRRLGEVPALLCTVDGGAEVRLDQVATHLLAKGLATYQLPTAVLVVDELPRTPTGKIARHRVQEMARGLAAERQTQSPWEPTEVLRARSGG